MEVSSRTRKIGLWTSTSLVIGNMIGAGVFLMPSALASYGGISIVGWLFSTAGAIFLALLYSKLSKIMPSGDGGPYAYTRKSFGDFPGFLVAWGYWVSTLATNATIAVSLVGALSLFIPVLGTNAIAAVGTALVSLWLLTWVNTLGIRAGGKVQLITTVLKLAPLLLIAVVGLFFIRLEYFTPFNLSGTSSFQAITATAAMTLFAFLGIESATIPAGAVDNPEKTIPRATMIGTIVTSIVYVFGTLAVLGLVPAIELQTSVTPFADAASVMFGEGSMYWVGAGVVIAALGALNGWILIQGQIPYAIAKDKLFPSAFAKLNSKGSPAIGIIIGSVIVSIFVGMNYTKGLVEQFQFLVLLGTTTILVPYLFSAGALIILYAEKNFMKTKGWLQTIFIGVGAFTFSLWAVAGTGQESVFWGFLLLFAGIPFYIWIVVKRDYKK